MTLRFSVRTVPQFDRLARRLTGQHPDFSQVYIRALDILEADPQNVSRHHNIVKLKGIPSKAGGQYRLRLGRFRFRYDPLRP